MILILSAVAHENAHLAAQLNQPQRSCYGPMELRSGQLGEHHITLATTGIGKANAAGISAMLLLHLRPALVVVCGCGGAYPSSGLSLGDLALASEELYADEGAITPNGFMCMSEMGLPLLERDGTRYFNSFPTDQHLTDLAAASLNVFAAKTECSLSVGRFITVSTCSGTDTRASTVETATGGICENMEGAAVAQMCRMFDTGFIEMRAISNMVETRNLSRWDLPGAMQRAQEALLYWLQRCAPATLRS
ncbi:MAG: futalosine hydrolase [Desulfuromonadaceae bacterium]|jgi:futalosine hydrolase|nr:futalosine hydrolase [Desulfuromonas sp.]MDY0185148.1 futalosine hydrolase [Desulfuromonadaceae bacterium]